MEDLQRFYDVRFSNYANMDFDSEYHGFDIPTFQKRIDRMINDNRELFVNAKSVYQRFSLRLEQVRWTLGENFYNFFVHQTKKIVAL